MEHLSKNITPQILLSDNTVLRNLDRFALSRIFGNIVNNAVKYSDGDIFVTMNDSGEITFTNTAYELFTVDAGRLFDRFYTVDSARKSTGLGLSIAKLLTDRMNGIIDSKYENDKLSIIISFKDD